MFLSPCSNIIYEIIHPSIQPSSRVARFRRISRLIVIVWTDIAMQYDFLILEGMIICTSLFSFSLKKRIGYRLIFDGIYSKQRRIFRSVECSTGHLSILNKLLLIVKPYYPSIHPSTQWGCKIKGKKSDYLDWYCYCEWFFDNRENDHLYIIITIISCKNIIKCLWLDFWWNMQQTKMYF